MQTSTTIHVTAADAISAKSANGFHWVALGDAAIFAPPAKLIELREAIDATLKAVTPIAEAA